MICFCQDNFRLVVRAWLSGLLAISVVAAIVAAVATVVACALWFNRQKHDGALAVLLTTPIFEGRLVGAYLGGALCIVLPAVLSAGCLHVLGALASPRWPHAWDDVAMAAFVVWLFLVPLFALQSLLALLTSAYYRTALAALVATFALSGGLLFALAVLAAMGGSPAGALAMFIILGLMGFGLALATLVDNMRSWVHRV